MLSNCFSASERSGNCSNSALCNRKKTVNNSLSCNKRHIRRKFFCVWSALTYSPFLKKIQFFFLTVFRLNYAYRLINWKFTFSNRYDCSTDAVRNHDFMKYYICFRYCANYISALYCITCFYRWSKCPFLITFKRWYLNAPRKIVSAYLTNIIKRTLNTVIDTSDKPRTEFCTHGLTCRFNSFTCSKTGCFLIYLYGCPVSVHFNDFTDKTLLAYTHNVKHIWIPHTLCNNKRTWNFYYISNAAQIRISF